MDPIQEFLQSIGAGTPGNGLPGGGVNGLRASTPGAPGLPGIDDAWRTRIPQGWIKFPDGSIGPPNPSSPIDSAWQTRVPTPQSPGGPLAPFAPPGSPALNGGSVPPGVRGPLAAPGGPGGPLATPQGPQVVPPENSTIPNMKSVGPFTGGSPTENMTSRDVWLSDSEPKGWTSRFTNGPRVDPGAFAGGEMPGSGMVGGIPGSVLNSLPPHIRALILAGSGILTPSPTASNDTISPEMAGQLPEHPHSTGRMPAGEPFTQPEHPHSTGRMPSPDGTSDTPLPPPRPRQKTARKKIDPKSVDLGQVPRFNTVQYQVPNSTRNAPIYTALDLSRLFGGSK